MRTVSQSAYRDEHEPTHRETESRRQMQQHSQRATNMLPAANVNYSLNARDAKASIIPTSRELATYLLDLHSKFSWLNLKCLANITLSKMLFRT